VLHRPQDQAARWLDAANDLNDDVGPGDELLGVRGEQRGVDSGDRTDLLRAADRDPHDLQGKTDACGEVHGMLGQQPRHG